MNYRSIKQSLFYDPEFESLSPLAQYLLVMLRLRSTNIIALYRPDWDSIRGLLKVSDKQLRALLSELRKKPWAVEEHGFVWIVNGFRYELGEKKDGTQNQPNINHRNAVGNSLSSTPNLHIVSWFCHYYHGKGFGELFDEVIEPYTDPSRTLPEPFSSPARQSGSGSGSGSGSDSGSETGTGTEVSRRVLREPTVEGTNLARLLHTRILNNFPSARVSKLVGAELEERVSAWGVELERIMRCDKRTPDELRAVIDFAHNDNVPRNGSKFCWASVTLSPNNLRNDNLWAQFSEARPGGAGGKPSQAEVLARAEAYSEGMIKHMRGEK